MTVDIGGNTYKSTAKDITGKKLNVSEYVPVTVTIGYDDDGVMADSNVNVTFGDIILTYSTLN